MIGYIVVVGLYCWNVLVGCVVCLTSYSGSRSMRDRSGSCRGRSCLEWRTSMVFNKVTRASRPIVVRGGGRG